MDVLRAVVSRYVETGEPVSSKAVATASELDVSSATIRNDMGALEDAGLIYQPHTSAGRVPTELGYREFVDRLTQIRPLSVPQRRAVQTFLSEAADFDDVISRTIRLLSQLTGSAAVIEYPTLGQTTLRRLDMVDLHPGSVLIIAVNSQGRIAETTVHVNVDSELVMRLRRQFDSRLMGLDPRAVADEVRALVDEWAEAERDVARQIGEGVVSLCGAHGVARLASGGFANLARSSEILDVSAVLDTIEEQVVMLRLLAEVHTDPLEVSIGEENLDSSLRGTAVVSASYGQGARVGIVGPTRMDYPGSLAAVQAVARYLARMMERG